jgi:hypothetical protein
MEREKVSLISADDIAVGEMPVARITVGPRHRKDLGDIASLAKSIRDLGLLQPLAVTPEGRLVAGRRRLEAVRELGWERVAVKIVRDLDDALLLLRAEREENTCRKDFTPSEAVAIGATIEALEKGRARERQRASRAKKGEKVGAKGAGKFPAPIVAPVKGGGHVCTRCEQEFDRPVFHCGGPMCGEDGIGWHISLGSNCPHCGDNGKGAFRSRPGAKGRGRVRDKVAGAVGMSGRTYEKAKQVVEAAAAEPEKFGDLAEKMDKSGSVHNAHGEMKRRKRTPEENAEAATEGQRGKALDAAYECLNLLRRIGKSNPYRARGFQVVMDWIRSSGALSDGARVPGAARETYARLRPTLAKLKDLLRCDRSTFAPSIIAGHAQVLEREIKELFNVLGCVEE